MHAYTGESQFEVEHVHLAPVSDPDRVIPVDGDGGGSVHGVRASARQNGHYTLTLISNAPIFNLTLYGL